MFDAIGEGHRIMHEGVKKEIDLDELERMTKKKPVCSDDIMDLLCAIPDLIAENRELRKKVRELEGRIAELSQENSNHKREIHILENKVLELKGKPIPMEPRQPTCDAPCRPRYILQSNCSNAAKEAGE